MAFRTGISILLLAYLGVDLWRMNKAGPSFAIQDIQIKPADETRVVYLRGRRSGLIGWLQTLLGLEADARFEVTEHDLRIERHSLKGFEFFYAPMHDLSSSTCGYYRGVSFVLICISLLAGGYFQLFTAWLIDDAYARQAALSVSGRASAVAAIFAAVAYGLFEISKRITISVETTGGVVQSIAFKRSVIENVTIGLSEAREAVVVLNSVLLRARPSLVAAQTSVVDRS